MVLAFVAHPVIHSTTPRRMRVDCFFMGSAVSKTDEFLVKLTKFRPQVKQNSWGYGKDY